MRAHNDEKRIDTTLGELVETVSEIAFEYSDDSREAYLLARHVLEEMLKNTHFSAEGFIATLCETWPRKNYFN